MSGSAQKYIPRYAKARPWNEIESHYIQLNKHGWHLEEMSNLVRFIKEKYDFKLFGYTSMDKLVVSIYEKIEYNREALHISYSDQNKEWTFEYYEKPFTENKFLRHYSADNGIEKFESFIQLIKW